MRLSEQDLSVLTPSSVVAPAILGLEVLCGQAWRAIALPDAVGEEAFGWDDMGNAATVTADSATADGTARSGEHKDCRSGGCGWWWP